MSEMKKVIVIMVLLALVAALATPFVTAQVGSQRTVLENLANIGEFSTMLGAVRAAGLDNVLKGPGQFTIFAPTNAAFDKLPKNQLNALMNDQPRLSSLMQYHAVPGKMSYSDLSMMTDVKTVDGKTLPINIKDGALMVGGTKILSQGIDSKNGIIYPVDGVMMPPGFSMAQTTRSTGLGWLPWLLGALILGAAALYLYNRSKKSEEPRARYEEARPRVEERRPVTEETRPVGAPVAAPEGEKIVLDESAVDELKGMDKSKMAGIKAYLIGSYQSFKNMLDMAKDYGISLIDVRDLNAVKRLEERYGLSPFNSNALELALENNGVIYSRDPSLLDKYRAAGAKTGDLRSLKSRM
jgi:uncharacterized surface protein with fasciclin (FAS1) repeats